MAKENTVLTIDIGGDSLKMAEFSFPPEGGLVLDKFAFVELEDELRESGVGELFEKAYNKLLEEHQFKSKEVRVSISGQAAFSRLSKLPPLGDDREHIEQIVEYEAKQTVPYPMDEVVWDYQLIKHAVTGGKKSPAALVSDEAGEEPAESAEIESIEENIDEMEALFVAVKNDLVTEIAEIIQDSGKDIISIEIAPVAFFNAAKANQIGKEHCDLILNIGGRCSSLVFADCGRIFTRTIPIAGHSITQQIAKEFSISFADAEELKRRHGFVALGGAYEEPDSEVAATVSKIARNVMTRLHGEINRSVNVWRSQYGGSRPKRLFLGGGSSLMAYTPRFFNEKLKIPVEYLNAFQVVTLGAEVNKEELLEVAPMFCELIGMGLRHIANCPVEITLMPESIKRYKALQRKKPYFYASSVSVILCLLIFYWGVARRVQFDKARVDRTKEEVDKTNVMVGKVNKVYRELQSAQGQYNDAMAVIKKRQQWIELFDELQRLLPDMMWFTLIEGIGPSKKDENSGGGMAMPFLPGGGGGGGRSSNAQEVTTELQWLKFQGHSLVLKSNQLLEETLKKRIKESKFFDDSDEAVVFDNYVGDKGNNNITSFKLRVKLKEPIKK
jgi:Tfp pilus assembly PilM family ATPase/Tfp pilus assembly protein PilN